MSPLTILLVDDSKSARYALRLQLQRHGALVDTADSAEAALEKVKEKPPDAVFMDHTMPGMNGFEALELLKSDPKTTDIPVVMCTSNADSEFIAQAKRKGAAGILSKATAADKLPSLIEHLRLTLSAPGSGVSETPNGVSPGAHPAFDGLTEEQLDQRVRVRIEPLLDALAERLSAELAAETEQKLNTRFQEESKRLQRQLAAVEDRTLQTLQSHNAEERQQIAQMVQELIDTSVDQLTAQPAFLRRLRQANEASATSNAEQMIKRQAQEIAETVATKRSGEVAGNLIGAARMGLRTMYLLAAGAAGVGIAAAAAVYFLVR
jgi:CheY-like chemotaxis protein